MYFTRCKIRRTSKDNLFLLYCSSLNTTLYISKFFNIFVKFLIPLHGLTFFKFKVVAEVFLFLVLIEQKLLLSLLYR